MKTFSIVDRLGEIRASIAALREQEASIEKSLKAQGAGVFEGSHFRATVSVSERATVAWKDIAAKFDVSPQLKSAHTTHSEVVTIRVSARLTEKLAA